YLKGNQEYFLKEFEEKYYFWGEELQTHLWNDFEFNLANIAEDILFDEMYESTDLGLEMGNVYIYDTLNHHFTEQFRYIEKLTFYMKEWIKKVNESLGTRNRRTSLIQESQQDILISFNYTTTLEDIYNISDKNVLHIHGLVYTEDDLDLGHSNISRINYFHEKYVDCQNRFDEQSAPIYLMLSNYCSQTYKNVKKHIPQIASLNYSQQRIKYVNVHIHQIASFNYSNIKEVKIVIHSLGDVDLQYVQEIYQLVNNDVEWLVYYYDEKDIDMFREKLIRIGIGEEDINFIHYDTFYDLPLVT